MKPKKNITMKQALKVFEDIGEVAKISVSIETLKKIKCPRCNGDGTVTEGGGLAGEYDYKCSDCRGNGIHPIVNRLLRQERRRLAAE